MSEETKSVPSGARQGAQAGDEKGESATSILMKLLLFAGIPLAIVYAVKLFAS